MIPLPWAWLATGNILAWMTLIDPGVGEVLQQKIAELKGKNMKEEIGKTIGSGFIAAGAILVLAVIAGFVFYSLIGAIINKDVTVYHNLQIALFISIISTGMTLTSFSMAGIKPGLAKCIAGGYQFYISQCTFPHLQYYAACTWFRYHINRVCQFVQGSVYQYL